MTYEVCIALKYEVEVVGGCGTWHLYTKTNPRTRSNIAAFGTSEPDLVFLGCLLVTTEERYLKDVEMT